MISQIPQQSMVSMQGEGSVRSFAFYYILLTADQQERKRWGLVPYLLILLQPYPGCRAIAALSWPALSAEGLHVLSLNVQDVDGDTIAKMVASKDRCQKLTLHNQIESAEWQLQPHLARPSSTNLPVHAFQSTIFTYHHD